MSCCQLNSNVLAIQPQLAYPSVPPWQRPICLESSNLLTIEIVVKIKHKPAFDETGVKIGVEVEVAVGSRGSVSSNAVSPFPLTKAAAASTPSEPRRRPSLPIVPSSSSTSSRAASSACRDRNVGSAGRQENQCGRGLVDFTDSN